MICLHNTPATYVKIPTYAAPTKDIDGTFYFFICVFLLNLLQLSIVPNHQMMSISTLTLV